MTREEAIKVCTREKECVQSALDVCADGGHYVSPDGIITAMDYVEAMDMAISALREQGGSFQNGNDHNTVKDWPPYMDLPGERDVTDINVGSKWISVEERLPTPYQNVIVWRDNYLDNGGCVDIDFTFTFNDGDVEWADHLRTWKSVVTHWMPLPEGPEVEV